MNHLASSRRTAPLISAVVAFALSACAGASPPAATPDGQPVSAPQASTQEPSAAPSTASAATPSEPPAAQHADVVEIDIAQFAFAPADVTVSAGTTVRWTNRDTAPHTVTAGTDAMPMPEVFASPLLEQGDTFEHVFEEAGTFTYYCERHPPMEARVVVEDSEGH